MPIDNIYRGIQRPRAEGFATLADFAGQFLQNREDREVKKDREAARALQQQDRQLRQQQITIQQQEADAQARQLKTDEEKLAATQALVKQFTGPDGLVDYEAVSNGLGAIDLKAKAELDKHLADRAEARRKAELDKLTKQKTELDLRKSQLEADATDVKTWMERYAAIKDDAQKTDFWQDVSESKMLGKLRTAGLSTNSTPEDAAGLILGAKGRADLAAKQANEAPSSDYGRFETDYIKAEADRMKRPVQALTPADLVRIKTEARKAFGQADDRPTGSGGMTPYAESNVLNRLVTQWNTASKPARDLQQQVKLMDAGLNAARRGDMAQGSQAILVTFQKILDPTSVVRESEYMRSAAGQSLLNRISGAVEQLRIGGAKVPLPELDKFAQLAREAAKAQSTGYLDAVKARIGRSADHYKIPRDMVFEDFDLASGTPTAPGGAGTVNPVGRYNPATGKVEPVQ